MGSRTEWKGQRNNNVLENRTEITQSEKQRENRLNNKINRASGASGIIIYN